MLYPCSWQPMSAQNKQKQSTNCRVSDNIGKINNSVEVYNIFQNNCIWVILLPLFCRWKPSFNPIEKINYVELFVWRHSMYLFHKIRKKWWMTKYWTIVVSPRFFFVSLSCYFLLLLNCWHNNDLFIIIIFIMYRQVVKKPSVYKSQKEQCTWKCLLDSKGSIL